MTGFGTMVNAAAILLGSTVGLLLKGGLPKRLQDIITSAVGLCVIFVGASGALAGLLAVSGDGLETRDTMMMIFSMAAGAALGEWMDIERRLEGLGAWCRTRIPAGHAGAGFVDAFVTSSLLFCVGAMAIVGSLEDGLSHNYSTLFAKSVMDGIMAAVFAAAMGIGTMFSVIPVVIYQGSITLLAGALRPFLTELMISRMSCAGSILIFALGLNLAIGTKIKIGNMLPAAFLPVVFCVLGF